MLYIVITVVIQSQSNIFVIVISVCILCVQHCMQYANIRECSVITIITHLQGITLWMSDYTVITESKEKKFRRNLIKPD